MATRVEQTVTVNVPVRTAYDQWTQFEEFPRFMGGIHEVQQLDDTTLHWVAEIAGVRREWDAAILEQVPDQKIAWAATAGTTNAGAVRFEPAGADQTRITLSLEYEPEGVVEQTADRLNLIERQVEADLAKFKELIEGAGFASGAWRGSVNEGGAVGTPGVESAEASSGDSGGAGISAKTVVAGAAVAAAGIAAGVLKGRSGESDSSSSTIEESIDVEVPVSTAYNQWTQFEEFPRFMDGIQSVTQQGDTHLHWVASIAGRTVEWDAEITEQHPDHRVAWRSTDGKPNAGVVTFHQLDPSRTRIMVQMDYDPEGIVETAGDKLGFAKRRLTGDLERFKELIEGRGVETGAWRGDVENASDAGTSI